MAGLSFASRPELVHGTGFAQIVNTQLKDRFNSQVPTM